MQPIETNQEKFLEKISGIIERITYHNEENGWSIVKVSPFDTPNKLVAVEIHQAQIVAGDTMDFFGAWAGLSRQQIRSKTDELLQIMSLTAVRDKPVHKFSGGMKRRVNLAIGVIHDPQILFLDEPTVGVDIQTRYAIIAYLKKLNEKGTTLVYTSHHLKEAEDLCHTIAMIDEGNILVNDTLETLLKTHRQDGLEGLFLDLTGREYRD